MEYLRKGDKCPCCGQPIQTDNPDDLYVLNQMKIWMDHRTGRINASEAYHRSAKLILEYSGMED